MSAESVDFFFDPGCPYTWRTSRWLHDVAGQGAATITWRLMSLGILNEGNDVPEQYREPMRQGARALRVLDAAGQHGDNETVGRLYAALGKRAHDDGSALTDEVIADAVREAGLPDSVAAAVDDQSHDAAVRTSHEESQAAVGQEAGSPIIRLGERAYFGPVVVPVPHGADAMRLFEAVRLLAAVPAFSELKTSRNPI